MPEWWPLAGFFRPRGGRWEGEMGREGSGGCGHIVVTVSLLCCRPRVGGGEAAVGRGREGLPAGHVEHTRLHH